MTLTVGKPLRIRFGKVDGLLELICKLDIYYYLGLKNITSFITGLVI